MAITHFGSASNPADNGAANEPTTLAITPPGSMVTGDLVIIGGIERVTTANLISQSELGGQSWTALLDDTDAGSNNVNGAFWFCEFDGTWDADPSIAFAAASGTVSTTAVMHVFRGATGWAIDTTMTKQAFASAASPSITAQDPTANEVLMFAVWGVAAARTWSGISGAGWAVSGSAQYRNTAGSDISFGFAYNHASGGAAPANVTYTQSVATAGLSFIGTLSGTLPASDTLFSQSIM